MVLNISSYIDHPYKTWCRDKHFCQLLAIVGYRIYHLSFLPLFGPFFTFLMKNQRIYILISNFFSGWVTILNINPGSIALGSPLIRIQRYKQNNFQLPEFRKLRKQATNAPRCFLNSATLGTFEHTNSAVADFRNE